MSEAFDGDSPSQIIARLVDTTVDSAGDVRVSATNEGSVTAQVSNASSTVVVTFTKAEAFALGILIASNLVNLNTRAEILFGNPGTTYVPTDTPTHLNPGDQVAVSPGVVYVYTGAPRGPPPINLSNAIQHYSTSTSWTRVPNLVHADGSVSVTAEESAGIDAESTVEVTATADSTAGMNIVLDLLTAYTEDYQYTNRSGTRLVTRGQAVRLDSAVGGGDADTVYVYKGADNAGAGILIDLGAATYSSADWGTVVLGDTLDLLASLGISTTGILGADATGVGGMVVRNDVRGDVAATIANAKVTSGDDVLVSALESATIHATTTGTVSVGGGSYFGEGSSTAVNVAVATNVVLSSALATVLNTEVDAGTGADDTITVTAANTSLLDARTKTSTKSAGVSVGVTIAVNTVGIDSQNILYNIAEAIVGNVIATEAYRPARTEARVTRSDLAAGGHIAVTASSTATIESEVEASSVSIASSVDQNTTSVSVGVVVSMNRLRTTVKAVIEGSPSVQAGGGVAVTTVNTAGIHSAVTAPTISIAISGQQSKSVSIGVSIARNELDVAMQALVSGVADLDAKNGDVVVSASQGASITASSIATSVSIAAGFGGSSLSLGGGGASAINLLTGTADAEIINSTVTARATTAPLGMIRVTATQTATIDAVILAASLAVSGSISAGSTGIAIGISVARNLIGWAEYGGTTPATVRARTQGSVLDAQRGILVSATSPTTTIHATVVAAAVSFTGSAGGASTSVAAGGLYTENKVSVRVVAEIAGASSVRTQSGGVTVTALDHTEIISNSAAASVSAAIGTSTATSIAVGIAVAYNRVANEVTARIADVASLTTGGSFVTVTATDSATIRALTVAVAVALAAGGGTSLAVSGGGAIAFNGITTKTNASVERSTLGVDTTTRVGAVTVTAMGTSVIQALVAAVAASVAIGQNGVAVAIGASIALNLIGYDLFGDPDINVEDAEDASGFLIGTPNSAQVRARIIDTTIWSSGALLLTATAAQTIDALVAAGAVGIAGGDSGIGISVAGAFAGNRIRTDVEASISDPTRGAQRDTVTVGSASVGASSTSGIRAFSGAASIAGGFGGTTGLAVSIGLSIAWNQVGDTVVAAVDDVVLTSAGAVTVQSGTAGRPLFDLTGVTATQLDDLSSREDDDLRAFLVERFTSLGLITSGGTTALSSITKSSGIWTLTFTTSGSGARSFQVRSQSGQLFITATDATLFDATTLATTATALNDRVTGPNAALDAAIIARLVTAKLLTQDEKTTRPYGVTGVTLVTANHWSITFARSDGSEVRRYDVIAQGGVLYVNQPIALEDISTTELDDIMIDAETGIAAHDHQPVPRVQQRALRVRAPARQPLGGRAPERPGWRASWRHAASTSRGSARPSTSRQRRSTPSRRPPPSRPPSGVPRACRSAERVPSPSTSSTPRPSRASPTPRSPRAAPSRSSPPTPARSTPSSPHSRSPSARVAARVSAPRSGSRSRATSSAAASPAERATTGCR